MTAALWNAAFDSLGRLAPRLIAWDAACGIYRGQDAGRSFTVTRSKPWRILRSDGRELDFAALAARDAGCTRAELLEKIAAADFGAVSQGESSPRHGSARADPARDTAAV